MADDYDFKDVRRNFFIINILLILIIHFNIPIRSLKIFNVPIPLSNKDLVVSFGLFYLYYLMRYIQELGYQIRKSRENYSEYFLRSVENHDWRERNSEVLKRIILEILKKSFDDNNLEIKESFLSNRNHLELRYLPYHHKISIDIRTKILKNFKQMNLTDTSVTSTSFRVSKLGRAYFLNRLAFSFKHRDVLIIYLPLVLAALLFVKIALLLLKW